MKDTSKRIPKVTGVLWIVWGAVHVLAGVMTMLQDPSSGLAAIADAVAADLLVHSYHPAVAGVLNQHGWNLLWIGLITLVGGVMVWRANRTAIWLTCMIGGLADLGYFLFLDLPGHVNFVPGTVMTLISGSAIVLSAWVWYSERTRPLS